MNFTNNSFNFDPSDTKHLVTATAISFSGLRAIETALGAETTKCQAQGLTGDKMSTTFLVIS